MHCIHAILIPPFQATDQKHIVLPHGWKMQFVHEDAKYENAIIISTDYFGGGGEQSAVVIKDFQIVRAVDWNKDKWHPINDALRFFGLQKGKDNDEFDTINLGHYRSDEDISKELGIFEEPNLFETDEDRIAELLKCLNDTLNILKTEPNALVAATTSKTLIQDVLARYAEDKKFLTASVTVINDMEFLND